MKIQLIRLRTEQTIAFKEEMQEAFQHGFDFQSSLLTLGRADTSIVLPSLNRSFESYYKDDNMWQVLPDEDFYQSLEAEGTKPTKLSIPMISVWVVPLLPLMKRTIVESFPSST